MWISIQPVQQELDQFWSLYGHFHYWEVDLLIDFSWSGLLVNFGPFSRDKPCFHPSMAGTHLTEVVLCILTMVNSPLSEYNVTARRIPPSTSIMWIGESVHLKKKNTTICRQLYSPIHPNKVYGGIFTASYSIQAAVMLTAAWIPKQGLHLIGRSYSSVENFPPSLADF